MNVWFGLLLISLHWSAVFLDSTSTDPTGSGDGDNISGTTANIDSNKDSLATTASNEETNDISSVVATTANIDGNKESSATTASNEETNYNFSVILADKQPTSIMFQIELSLPNKTECQQIHVYQANVSLSQKCNENLIIRELQVGKCYNFTIKIEIKTAAGADELGTQYYYSCTKPRLPGKGSKVLSKTDNSLTVQLDHPNAGNFDSFEININGNQTIVRNRSEDNNTLVEFSNLQPGECYNLRIYTVLNGEKSNNPRILASECLNPLRPGVNFTVDYNNRSFKITWAAPEGYYDLFILSVNCQSRVNYLPRVKSNSIQVIGVTPGDCCRVDVTTQSHQINSTTQSYYVQINESGPESLTVKPAIAYKTELLIHWTSPVKTNGWILGYNVNLYNKVKKTMTDKYTVFIGCTQQEGSCSQKVDQRMFQCSEYRLANGTNQASFHMNESSFMLKIHGLQPGLMYYYSIEAYNSIGNNSTGERHISTLEDIPEPPASINISALNATSMNVSWSPPNKPNGQLISYKVSYGIIGGRFDNRTVGVNVSSVLLSALDCWTQYNVCVSTNNSVGFSLSKCGMANTTVYEPKSKIKSIVPLGSSSLSLDFVIPCESDKKIPIRYNISYQYTTMGHKDIKKKSTNITEWKECLFKEKCNITGLYSFWDYYIKVQESIGSEIGNWSDVKKVKTLASLPEPPASINISVLNTTSMWVSWSPPNQPNGVLISYKVSYAIIGGQFDNRTVGVDKTSVLLTGLECWTQYIVCVLVNNSEGFGEDLCDSANTTAYEPKSEIKSVVALGSSSVSLDFVIPCNYSQIPISYNVSYTTMSHECSQQNLLNITEYQECSFQESCEIKSLYSFWDYFIQVQERFRGNFGPWSKVFPVQTHKNYPDEVINLEIKICTSDSLTVCWDLPCFLNGHFVKYEITLDGQSRTTGTETCSTIDALMPYTYYNISVTVVNDFGRSQALDVVGRTDIAKPSKPNITRIQIDSRKVKVDWSPLNLYPGPTNYTVDVKDNESGVISSCYSSSFNLTTCTVDGLEEYWPYEVTVTARTKKGENSSVIRSMRTLEAAPGPVTNLSVKPEMNPENPRQIYIQFLAPELRHQNGILKAYYIICKAVQSGEIISVTKLEREAETKIPVPHQLLLNISVFGETIENGTVVFRTVIVPEGAKRFPVAGAVAGMLTAVVFIVVAVIIAIFYRKQMFCFKAPLKVKEAIGMNAVKPKKKTSGENVDKRKNRPIKNDRFYQHVEIMARDSNNFFAKEYKELKDLAPNLPTEAAQQQDARAKNRYSNILPFDHSRVKLLPFDDDEGSDYINANYIPGFNSQREYIATQGPLPSTKDDFWRMIWEQNVSVIVMLTQCVERGKRKCECYWPECVREPVYFGDLCIETETESHLPEYVLRTMKISLGNVTKCITHFLYLAWPDMGVPSSTDSMISLVKTVRSHVSPSMKGPMTVHCSAGVGRTGTFIAVDILLHKLDSDYNQMDIFGDVLTLRNYRCNMVQTEDQYIFIHHCISDYILALSEETDEEEAADGGDEPVYQNVIKK